ncbi:hypothetical protein GCM10027289_09460 [Tsukamurella serpentis]
MYRPDSGNRTIVQLGHIAVGGFTPTVGGYLQRKDTDDDHNGRCTRHRTAADPGGIDEPDPGGIDEPDPGGAGRPAITHAGGPA